MSFCKRMFLSVCALAIGMIFSTHAQEEELQSYTMKCFPLPFNGREVTICLGQNDEEGEEIEEGENEFATFDEDGFIIFKGANSQEGEIEFFTGDRDKMWIDLEGDLIDPAWIETFDRHGTVKPICGLTSYVPIDRPEGK